MIAAVVGRELVKELGRLEARVAELEASPFECEGVHQAGRSYAKRAVVTAGGSMWIAQRATAARPGKVPLEPGDDVAVAAGQAVH